MELEYRSYGAEECGDDDDDGGDGVDDRNNDEDTGAVQCVDGCMSNAAACTQLMRLIGFGAVDRMMMVA